MNEDLSEYFAGQRLFGDDFDTQRIAEWYANETEVYARLGASDRTTYRHAYHALNWYHGYRYSQGRTFKRVLGFGRAFGDKILPIVSRIESITILDVGQSLSQGAPTYMECRAST